MVIFLLVILALLLALSINGVLVVGKFRKEFDKIQLPKHKLTLFTIILMVLTAPLIGIIVLFSVGRHNFVMSVLEACKLQGKLTSEQEIQLLLLADKAEKW